ncbi:very short patch repair endonuclease [Herbaspirillum frisingense]|uniref:very short patch repair endonuclease n=1 Tax=Herbaspirillum frisingense TaxID=92645 RepID=UPI0022782F74|nr:very short patch repair endonuclease [Herbaspirillum frisingense]UIN21547.1 very short patch repair endonuclease [Herbaspirillum frisingense]
MHRGTAWIVEPQDVCSHQVRENVLRSANMSRIRGTNTQPELLLRKALWNKGLRYRLHSEIEGVRPDIVFRTRKLAVFIDGCFWHGCPLHYVRPRSKAEFWEAKLKANTARDKVQTLRLIKKGWTVLRFWEHQIKSELAQVVALVLNVYNNSANDITSRPVVTRVDPQADGTELWLIEDLLNQSEGRSEHRHRNPPKR